MNEKIKVLLLSFGAVAAAFAAAAAFVCGFGLLIQALLNV
jgi:hypothetical protein